MIFVILAKLVYWVCNILVIALIARSILSWLVYYGRQYNTSIGRIYKILTALTEPIVSPIRRFISRFINTGPIDVAPMAAFFVIIIINRILTTILYALAGAL